MTSYPKLSSPRQQWTFIISYSFKGQEVNLLGVGMKDNEVFITVFSDLCVLNLIVIDSNFL